MITILLFAGLLCAPILNATETGIASWYGPKFHGRQTANGEIFDTYALTAAHRTLPFNSIVRVTNLENGRSVEVRINDRGPFIRGRIIDLSQAAASRIGIVESGLARVRLEIVSHPQPDTYSAQIASFRNRANAENLQDRLAAQGFAARIETAPGGIYRVVLPGITADARQNTRQRLSAHGYKDILFRKE